MVLFQVEQYTIKTDLIRYYLIPNLTELTL